VVDPIELKPTNNVALFKTVKVVSSGRKQVVFQLTDDEGAPVNLTAEPSNSPAPAPDFVNSLPVRQNNVTVQLMAKDAYTGAVIFDVPGVIVPDTCPNPKSLVSFDLSPSATTTPGIYRAEVGRFAGGYLVDTWPVYVEIQPTVFGHSCNQEGPLTIPEVRMAIRDLQIGEISLLDALEFGDVEVMQAMRRVVDLWNETSPYLRRWTFTTSWFPFRYNWMQGTIAELLSMAAFAYDRNRLAYSAGGVSIDDQDKGPAYRKQSDAMKAEFMAWMIRKKRELNMRNAWSTI
jgi:hypothetical protein